jgi:NAD(P)-dependent dehydrogenase (short-subunit alcohol dehydrogenase family)
MSNPVIMVVGVGPGLGAAVARRFGAAGYDVALIARTASALEEIGSGLQAEGVTAGWTALDITDDEAFAAAIHRFGQHAGRLDVVHFNPSAVTAKGPLELSPAELLHDLHLGTASLLTAVQAARPFMTAGGRFTVTGSIAADRPWTEVASLGVQKAALRNLVTAVDDQLAPDGIRAASITVRGTIGHGTPFDPSLIAEAIYEVSQLPDQVWRSEVPYDGRTSAPA